MTPAKTTIVGKPMGSSQRGLPPRVTRPGPFSLPGGSRRSLLKQGAAVALALISLSGLAAACARGDEAHLLPLKLEPGASYTFDVERSLTSHQGGDASSAAGVPRLKAQLTYVLDVKERGTAGSLLIAATVRDVKVEGLADKEIVRFESSRNPPGASEVARAVQQALARPILLQIKADGGVGRVSWLEGVELVPRENGEIDPGALVEFLLLTEALSVEEIQVDLRRILGASLHSKSLNPGNTFEPGLPGPRRADRDSRKSPRNVDAGGASAPASGEGSPEPAAARDLQPERQQSSVPGIVRLRTILYRFDSMSGEGASALARFSLYPSSELAPGLAAAGTAVYRRADGLLETLEASWEIPQGGGIAPGSAPTPPDRAREKLIAKVHITRRQELVR